MTELGELAQEVINAKGRPCKEPGSVGITGETIDVILYPLDMIRVENPDMTGDELMTLVRPKLAKWRATAPRSV